VPDFELNILNHSRTVGKLSDFKGKLILLDFWGSWCYSCLLSFPKLNKLQQKYDGKLQVILVNSAVTTGDNKDKIIETIKKYPVESSVMVAFDDSTAVKLFPHHYLPHYVWITPSGSVKAISNGDVVTEENIDAILKDENILLNMPIKKDYFPDKIMDLSIDDGQLEIDETLEYYSVLKKGEIDGLNRVHTTRKVRNKSGRGFIIRGISMRNITPIEMFETAVAYSNGKIVGNFRKRMVLELKDPVKFIFDSTKSVKENWEKENLFTYDLIIPASEMNNIQEHIWRDINNYSGYVGRFETRKVKCLVLMESGKTKLSPLIDSDTLTESKSIIENEVHRLINVSCSALAWYLDSNPSVAFPVINKASGYRNINVEFNFNNVDLSALRKQLAALDLELKESYEQLNVLIISDRPLNNNSQ
jgi:thiol-disulfide isomerase/thioredoxin